MVPVALDAVFFLSERLAGRSTQRAMKRMWRTKEKGESAEVGGVKIDVGEGEGR